MKPKDPRKDHAKDVDEQLKNVDFQHSLIKPLFECAALLRDIAISLRMLVEKKK